MSKVTITCADRDHRWQHKGDDLDDALLYFMAHLVQRHKVSIGDVLNAMYKQDQIGRFPVQ